MPSPLKIFHSLIPATCDYVTLPGKGDFVDLIKLRILRRGDFPRLSGWAQSSHKGPCKKEAVAGDVKKRD